MRFSYCEEVITRRSFFLFSVEYQYEDEINALFSHPYGIGKFFFSFVFLFYEFHNSLLNLPKSFKELGLGVSESFADLLLDYFYPHINLKYFFFVNIDRYIKISSVTGKRLRKGLPIHGQRTHSNRKTVRKFSLYMRNFVVSMYLTNVLRMSESDAQEKISKRALVNNKLRNKLLRQKKNKKVKKQKVQKKNLKTKSKALPKKAKKKKVDVWK